MQKSVPSSDSSKRPKMFRIKVAVATAALAAALSACQASAQKSNQWDGERYVNSISNQF